MESNTHKKNLQLVARCGMLGCRDVVKILRETLEVHFKISETIELKTKEGYAVQYIYFSKMLILIM